MEFSESKFSSKERKAMASFHLREKVKIQFVIVDTLGMSFSSISPSSVRLNSSFRASSVVLLIYGKDFLFQYRTLILKDASLVELFFLLVHADKSFHFLLEPIHLLALSFDSPDCLTSKYVIFIQK